VTTAGTAPDRTNSRAGDHASRQASTADETEVFDAFCAAGLWPLLGKTVAARLPAAGIRRPDDVTEAALTAVDGISGTRAAKLATAFDQARPRYDVVAMLVPAGLPARLAFGVTAALGPGAAGQLADDPWRLLDAGDADLAGADRLARFLGVDRSAPGRGPAVLVHLLTLAARAGDTAATRTALMNGARSRGVPDPAASLDLAVDAGRIEPAEDLGLTDAQNGSAEDGPGDSAPEHDAASAGEGERLYALPRYAMAETALADGLVRLIATAEPIGEADTLGIRGLDDEQRAAVAAALEHGVSLLTGGPGTGKSRTVAAVVELATARGCRVALAAPTGRAAKRLEELGDAPAMTLHRLLGATPGRSSGDSDSSTGGGWDGPTFSRNEEWPLDADLVVVDEASMLDVELAAGLVEACSDGTHLLIVGDPAQLPSIGAGRVLGDMVDAGVLPTSELVTLYRQAEGGTIARLATAVRGGELPKVEDPEREVVVVPGRDSGDAARRVVQLVTDSIPRALGIRAGEIQVVTPVHRGPAGTEALNVALKEQLNPQPAGRTGAKAGGAGKRPSFDVGDRIVAVANHLDLGFANGEVGTVVGRTSEGLEIQFAAGPATVPIKAWSDLRHGWAITVHRAQGSEWPAVVVVLPPEAGTMLTRPLIYTALTRAQRHLSVVPAVGPALLRAVREVGGRPRTTQLRSLLQAGLAQT
jgi:exodeoxyribonuclease V alpha subunit